MSGNNLTSQYHSCIYLLLIEGHTTMSTQTESAWPLENSEKIAKLFSRLGQIGFWVQMILVTLPILLLLYVLLVNNAKTTGIDLGVYLSYGSLIVMLFTTFWFYRYTGLAHKIRDPNMRPSQTKVISTIWVGLWASIIGIIFSMVLMISAVARLLIVLLATPQTGVPIAVAGGDPNQTLSAIDAVSLASLLFTLSAELIVLLFSIWLLFKVTTSKFSR
jgi:hypothetical protein